MKKLAVATACASIVLAATASAAGPALYPHLWGVRITGAPAPAFNAEWRIAFSRTAFTVTRNRAVAVRGTVTIAGSRVTFRDVSGPFRCTGAVASGRYAWRIRGAKLTFTRLADRCPGRSALLSVPYTRVAG